AAEDGVIVYAVSALLETAPVDCPDGSGPFLNGAAVLETSLDPHALLELLLATERRLGRDRSAGIQNQARTIDLDLLLHGEQVIDSEHLSLPHPQMAERDFVMIPAKEIASDMFHPLLGCR